MFFFSIIAMFEWQFQKWLIVPWFWWFIRCISFWGFLFEAKFSWISLMKHDKNGHFRSLKKISLENPSNEWCHRHFIDYLYVQIKCIYIYIYIMYRSNRRSFTSTSQCMFPELCSRQFNINTHNQVVDSISSEKIKKAINFYVFHFTYYISFLGFNWE